MDNRNYTINFENGNKVTVRYEPYASPSYGIRAPTLVFDEFTSVEDFSEPLIDTFNSYQPGYTIRENWSGLNICEYECSFINGRFEMKKREAPDFGELSPSQELNDFVNTLVQGE